MGTKRGADTRSRSLGRLPAERIRSPECVLLMRLPARIYRHWAGRPLNALPRRAVGAGRTPLATRRVLNPHDPAGLGWGQSQRGASSRHRNFPASTAGPLRARVTMRVAGDGSDPGPGRPGADVQIGTASPRYLSSRLCHSDVRLAGASPVLAWSGGVVLLQPRNHRFPRRPVRGRWSVRTTPTARVRTPRAHRYAGWFHASLVPRTPRQLTEDMQNE